MRDLDKYIEYVIAQVGEGGHTRNELVDDLKERGLNDDEIGENWDTLINDLTQNVQFDGYEADVQSFDDRIEYMTITSR